jgi:hypothetical protein
MSTRLKFSRAEADRFGMERRPPGYRPDMKTRDDDDGLWSEVGQTLALFGMSVAVVLVGLLMGLGL